jgi:predicted GH43/DUF377 family glycosyl hydrolase
VRSQFEGFEVIGTFNPAAIEFDDGIALLVRVAERPTEIREGYVALPHWNWRRLRLSGHLRLTFISWLLVAFSRDGLSIDRFGEAALLPATRYEAFGIEDPRLAKFGDRFYFTYVAVSEHGVATALASTDDFRSFERHGIIFCPENKDVVLFPETINGQYVALHRPNPNAHFCPPEIWIARSPDLLHWGGHERLIGRKAAWATIKIGGGTPPVRTGRGWLSLFHGHIASERTTDIGQYAAATMLLDLDDPRRITGVSPKPVMRAETDFERSGFLPNIVFPTALVSHADKLDVYYGAADAATGVARYSLDEMLATVEPDLPAAPNRG